MIRFLRRAGGLVGGLILSCTPPPRQIRTADEINGDAKIVEPSPQAETELPVPVGQAVSFASELSEVSHFRKLKADEEIRGLKVEIGELLAHVERSVDLETPAHALRGTEEMLVALGVVPLTFQYRATMVQLLRGQLAGLYDPHLRMMLLRDDLGEAERKMTLLHELVHALQDQNFDLSEVVEWSPDDTDRSSALSALAEGDATSAMFDGILPDGRTAISLERGFIQRQMANSPKKNPKESEIPALIQRSLRAPYLDGITFVHALRRRGGWDEVNRVWQSPPETTEQLLHIEKYDEHEPALDVQLVGPPAAEGWKIILHDIWGEQSLRLIFEEWLPPEQATQRASGWGGDRIVVYEKGAQRALAWHIRADTPEIAQSMYQTFSEHLQGEAEAQTTKEVIFEDEALPTRCGGSNASRQAPVLAVTVRRDHILIVGSPYERKPDHLGSCQAALGWLSTQLALLF